jgi:predicted acetyltransferase
MDILVHTHPRPPWTGAFAFLDPGPLVDAELELVAPGPQWVDGMLAAAGHPLTWRGTESYPDLTRPALERFLEAAPSGHEPPDPARGRVPTYHFWMHLRPEFRPPVSMAGSISLRVANTREVVLYYGHIGYGVLPPARGRHLALRACRLLLPLARAHGLSPLWITTGPDNIPSRRTCERLGAQLVETIPVPDGHPLRQAGQHAKCRYRLDV